MAESTNEDEKKRPLTEEEKAECARLKQIYEAKKKDLGLTQDTLGDILDITQGAVGHYLNGRSRIGDLLLLRLSVIMQFDPEKVKPGFFARFPELLPDRRMHPKDRPLTGAQLRAQHLVDRIAALGDQGMDGLESMLDSLER